MKSSRQNDLLKSFANFTWRHVQLADNTIHETPWKPFERVLIGTWLKLHAGRHFPSYATKFFVPSNEALDSHLKSLAKTGVLSSTKHKQALEREDVEQLFTAKQLGNGTPESLLQTAWFYLMLYFGKRGRENQRNMVKEDIVFGKTANGLEYIALRERATKNHPGGLRDNEDNSQAVMCEWPDNPERCPVRCIKKYLEKRNPNCPALWQKPRNYSTGKFNESDGVWYCNVPLGKNTLENLLSRMSKKAGLSTHFTSHYIRATSVTILKAAGLDNSRVRSVTGHKSDASIESYHRQFNNRYSPRQ